LVDFFGPLSGEVIAEDAAYAFRALFHKGILHIPHALVKYRAHDKSLTTTDLAMKSTNERESLFSRHHWLNQNMAESCLHDLALAFHSGKLLPGEYRRLILLAEGRARMLKYLGSWWKLSLPFRYWVFLTLGRSVLTPKELSWARKRLVPRYAFMAWRSIRPGLVRGRATLRPLLRLRSSHRRELRS